MAKDKNVKNEPVQEPEKAVAAPPTVDNPPTAMVPAPPADTAIATIPNSRESYERFAAMLLDGAPEKYVPGFQEMLLQMDPERPGFAEEVSGEWRPPALKVRQNSSRDAPPTAKPGEFYLVDGSLPTQPVVVAPLFFFKERTKFDEDGGERIECSSPDSVTARNGRKCADCMDSRWVDQRRPRCAQALLVICLLKEGGVGVHPGQLVSLRFKGNSYKNGLNFLGKAKGTTPPWLRWFALSSSLQQQPKPHYIIMAFPNGETVDPQLKPKLDQLNAAVQALWEARQAQRTQARTTVQQQANMLDSGQPEGSDTGSGAGFSGSF